MNLNYRNARKCFSRLGLAYFSYAATALAAQILVWIVFAAAGLDRILSSPVFSISLSMGCMYLVGFPVYLFLLRQVPVRQEVSRGRPLSAGSLTVFLIICMGIMEVGNLIGTVLMLLVSSVLGRPIENQVISMISDGSLALNMLFSVGVAPVFEELMFRKLLIDRIRLYGDRTSILVSGVMFGLIHGNFYQFFYACGLGMILAYVYLRTGRLRYPIILHMAINFLGGMVGAVLLRWSTVFPAAGFLTAAYTALLILASFAGITLLICLRKKRVLKDGPEEIPPFRRFSTAFFNPGMLLFFLITALQFWMNMR